jgi:DNA-binding NtrC family response regulator
MSDNAKLACWIGIEDMEAAMDKMPHSDPQYGELSELWKKCKDEDILNPFQMGPIRGLLDGPFASNDAFKEIHLLSAFPQRLNEYFEKWLNDRRIKIHPAGKAYPDEPRLSIEGSFERVYAESKKLLNTIREGDCELCLYTTPGTRTTEAVWVLLGKTQFPATLYSSREGIIFNQVVPFDITADVYPILLRAAPDRIREIERIDLRNMLGFQGILGKSILLKDAARRAVIVARSEATVLLMGETGTGKEMFAEAIHKASRRGQEGKVYYPENCAAVPKDLLESVIFGHEKGSFTGATERQEGAFEKANGGTLFLDEVGELSLEHQAKLLRVLEPIPDSPCRRRIRRLGGAKEIPVDVRIIAATNRDLWGEVQARRFREDLYYRLARVCIRLPPLRERPIDIGILTKSIMDKLNQEHAQSVPVHSLKSLTRSALKFLQNQPWPGNVRQLQSVLQEAVMFSSSATIDTTEIKVALRTFASEPEKNLFSRPRGEKINLDERMKEIELTFIEDALKEAGTEEKAGELLCMPQSTLNKKKLDYRKLKKEG